MATQILNNGATLKVVISGVTKLIAKSQIREISIVKTNIIKIDTGQEIKNLFLTYGDVSIPTTAGIDELVNELNNMLSYAPASVGATEAKQDTQISHLITLKNDLALVKSKLDSLDSKVFFDALLVDESSSNTIYRGFALPGASTSSPVWAIERTTLVGEVTVKKWSGGNRSFAYIWDNRENLGYF